MTLPDPGVTTPPTDEQRPTKHRITVTAVLEFDAVPENYPQHMSPQEWLALDIDAADDDCTWVLEDAEITVTGEVLK